MKTFPKRVLLSFALLVAVGASLASITTIDLATMVRNKLGLANGGTNVDLSGTGGANAFLAQAADHSISARQPAYTDITGLSTVAHTGAWSDLQDATGALTLANGANATTFNQTSAANWTWANTTAATNLGVNAASPLLNLSGTYFTLGASATDNWSLQDVIATAHTSSTVTNIAETAGNVVTLTITGGNFVVGDIVTFTGMTAGFGDWLNGTNQTLTAASATSLTFTDSTAHGLLASHATSGQVTQANPNSLLTISHSGLGAAAVNMTASLVSGIALIFGGATTTGIGSVSNQLSLYSQSSRFNFYSGTPQLNLGLDMGSKGFQFKPVDADTSMGILGHHTAVVSTAAVVLGNSNALAGLSGTQDLVRIGAYSVGSLQSTATFSPAYGTGTFNALNIAPTINQAAVTDTIAGVQVTGGNLVTLVFADTTSTFTNGATTLTVAAVTNTAVNGSGNTIASYVRRTGITVVTNSAEAAVTNVVTLSMANTGSMATNDYISITGLTVATWLNGTVVKLTGVSANVSITFVDPTGHGLKASGAEGGGVVICHYLTYSKTISNITLGSDTGTATQQATGAYTGLKIAVTETALGGTPNYLINALAGASGTTQVFAVDNLGSMYLAKAAAGAPTSAGTAGTIGQIVRYGGVLYFCSVTGAAGAATWNILNMTVN